MPTTPTYPGVYIEEVASGVRTIVGVATSITAFIGRALRGSTTDPVRIGSYADFERAFGGLWSDSTMSYAVQHYFFNGGSDAIIVRVHNSAASATLTLPGGMVLQAASEGNWGNHLRARVDYDTRPALAGEAANKLFNLAVKDMGTGVVERFLNVYIDASHPRYVVKVLKQESSLVRATTVPATRPTNNTALPTPTTDPFGNAYSTGSNSDGGDGGTLTDTQISDPGLAASKLGIWALQKVDLFNLLCIPPLAHDTDVGAQTLEAALAFCKDRRAMLIVDSPATWTGVSSVTDTTTGIDGSGASNTLKNMRDRNATVFFPRLTMPDPLHENRFDDFVPCGAVAGIFARTDAQRGVWKAPAGLDARLLGVADLTVKLTDGENGQLNPLGVNCLRFFAGAGQVVWGARTLEGSDRLASEYKYVPVRRTALFIEESLYRGTQWVVFEPNDEPLWAQIRLNVGAFMHNLFRQGAFQGKSPREAYFVKCDGETTTQNDINLGIVNIVVGFAPLKPAEFVIIQLQQMAGQIEV